MGADNPGRPFAEFREEGLLWLVNTAVFHPRGYALSLHFENDDPENLGACTGWSLMGDGSESWRFGCDDKTTAMLDDLFVKVKALMP